MSNKNDDKFIECPECGAAVKSNHISTHLARIHSKITEDYTKKIEEQNKNTEKKDRRSRKTVNTNYIKYKRKKSIMYFGALFIIIALIFAGYFYFANNDQPKKGIEIEEKNGIIGEAASSQNPIGDKKIAPNFSLTDATGKTISLQSFKGKVVILHFMQILSDCHGGYFYKTDDRAPYDSSLTGFVALTGIKTIHQFDELKKIYNKYSSDDVVIISVIIPPGCCGDPLQFSKDIKNQFDVDWYVASDNKQYDTWYKFTDFLPYDKNHVLTTDPTILVLDKNDQYVVYNSGYTDAATLSGI